MSQNGFNIIEAASLDPLERERLQNILDQAVRTIDPQAVKSTALRRLIEDVRACSVDAPLTEEERQEAISYNRFHNRYNRGRTDYNRFHNRHNRGPS